MDTTQEERPLSAILGWELKTESWPEENWGGPADIPYVQKTRDYYEAPDGAEREPTVDDMLTWLRFNAHEGEYESAIDVEVNGPEMIVRWRRGKWDYQEATGATLLEAFENAVRAVAQ